VILTEIYPARELPIEGVTSELIYDNLKPGVKKQMINKSDVLSLVKSRDFDVLIILGAGDLDNQVAQITKILQEKIK
jgi:UDP-N-acetylmuramate--alanine ligase